MTPKLAILIPTIEGREAMLERLMGILKPQLMKYNNGSDKIDILFSIDGITILKWREVWVIQNKDRIGQKTIGQKRNELTVLAIESGATHRSFIDDDDMPTDDYLDLNMPGVYGNYDCNSLVGIYTVNGKKNPKKHIFIHSLKYDHWYEDDQYYYRNPNHLNVVSLAKCGHILFPESNFGEDGQWSERIHAAGCLKTEYEITKPFYNYLSRTKIEGI